MQLLQTTGKYKGKIRRDFTTEEFEEICLLTPHIKDQTRKSIRERIFCILNGILEYPKCLECSKDVHFLRSGKYSKTCTNSCGVKFLGTQDKIKSTKLERYNNSTFNNPEKMKETCLERYSVEHTSKIEENRILAKESTFEKFGNYNNIEKIRCTNLERYGVDNVSKTKEVKDKISLSISESYKNRKINENDYVGVVYILHFKDLDLIKIGLTSDFEKRSKQLKRDFGKFSIIQLIKSSECFKLEQEFHLKYNNYRVCLDDGCGRTEFFSVEITEMLLSEAVI